MERAKSLIGKGGVTALVIAPLAVSVIRAPRASATVLYGFNDASVGSIGLQNNNQPTVQSFHVVYASPFYAGMFYGGGYGGSFVPAASVSGSTTASGSTHVTGTLPGATGGTYPTTTGGQVRPADATYTGTAFDLQITGTLTGTLDNATDQIQGHVNVNFSATGGQVSFQELSLQTNVGLSADDSNAQNIPLDGNGNGNFEDDVYTQQVGAPTDVSGGTYTLDLVYYWTGYSNSDTLNVTIPDTSIDIGTAPLPEPTIGVGVGATTILLARRRRRKSAVSEQGPPSG
jgi:hypothetical protein